MLCICQGGVIMTEASNCNQTGILISVIMIQKAKKKQVRSFIRQPTTIAQFTINIIELLNCTFAVRPLCQHPNNQAEIQSYNHLTSHFPDTRTIYQQKAS